MTKLEMQAKIDELETQNSDLALELEWNARMAEKVNAAKMTKTAKKAIKIAKKAVAKSVTEKDAFGQRMGTFSATLNSYISDLIIREKYNLINAQSLEKLSTYAGQAIPKARWNSHLNFLRDRLYI